MEKPAVRLSSKSTKDEMLKAYNELSRQVPGEGGGLFRKADRNKENSRGQCCGEGLQLYS